MLCKNVKIRKEKKRLRKCCRLKETREIFGHDFTFHFSLSCIGEGNGNPLQCSCLENPRDGGTSWAAVYGVAQSQTRLKRGLQPTRLLHPQDFPIKGTGVGCHCLLRTSRLVGLKKNPGPQSLSH